MTQARFVLRIPAGLTSVVDILWYPDACLASYGQLPKPLPLVKQALQLDMMARYTSFLPIICLTTYLITVIVFCTLPLSADAGQTLRRLEPILTIPADHSIPADLAMLGEALFHDPRLSSDNSISCAHCHKLDQGGMDSLKTSPGVNDAPGVINTPTVYNSAFNLAQFWDGRAATLEEQVPGPIHSPIEMASNWHEVISKLKQDESLLRQFNALFADGVQPANIQAAIAAFERTLITPDSPFDQWLRGDEQALCDEAKQGYLLFKQYGCISCHQGMNVGGNMYQLMGAMGDYFADRGDEITRVDLGRYNVTGEEADRHMFKVPSLRLASHTAPYFHDGSTHSLVKAIQLMGHYQLGREISPRDARLIAAFIASLAGEYPPLPQP